MFQRAFRLDHCFIRAHSVIVLWVDRFRRSIVALHSAAANQYGREKDFSS
jgi:hypothetical protein